MNSSATSEQATATRSILYIMGRGHSGTTALDVILGNAPGVESVGELVSGILKPNQKCSCGECQGKCSFWEQVRTRACRCGVEWPVDIEPIISQAHLKNLPKTLLSPRSSPWVTQLTTTQEALFNALYDVANARVLVDSSKEVTRGFFLLRFLPETKVIHIVRNPEGILASNMHRIESEIGFKFLRVRFTSKKAAPLFLCLSALGWLVGNFLAEISHLLFGSRVLRIRYEDLMQDPEGELRRIAGFTGIDLNQVIRDVALRSPLSIGHNIGGNHMRMKESFVFDPAAGKKRHLAALYRILARLLCWPLMLAYGYRLCSWQASNPISSPTVQS